MSTISENIFDQNHVGVLSFFDQAQHIHHNQINFDQTGMPEWSGFGVWVSNAVGGADGSTMLHATDITNNDMEGLRVGIEVRSTIRPLVTNNRLVNMAYHTAWPNPHMESFGIYLRECGKSIIADNLVTGGVTEHDWGWWDTGIRTDNCAVTNVVCNTTENLHNSLVSMGPALTTYYFDDRMDGYHLRGITQGGDLLGQQGSATAPVDIEWDGTVNLHTHTLDYTQNAQPIFVRDGVSNTPLDPSPNFTALASPSGQQPLAINPATANPGAESPYGCPVHWRNVAYLHKVLHDSIFEVPLAEKPLAVIELFRAIDLDSALQADPLLQAWHDSVAQTPLGRLSQLTQKLHPDIDAQSRRLLAEQAHLATKGHAEKDSVLSLWSKTLEMAYLRWQHPDTTIALSGRDTAYLQQVALLCPLTHGPAVGLARTLLFEPTKDYFSLVDECEVPVYEEPSNRRGQEDASVGAEVQVKVYPNPTSGHVTIDFVQGEPGINCTLNVTATDGKRLLQKRVSRPRSELNLGLAPGIYLYEVICDDGLIEKGKLVITAK